MWQVTFTEGRTPLPSKESLENGARIEEAHQLPPPTWQTGWAPHDGADWSRPEEGEGEEDLECSPLLEAHLQELLGESPPANAKIENGLMSMSKDPEPSPLHQSHWI